MSTSTDLPPTQPPIALAPPPALVPANSSSVWSDLLHGKKFVAILMAVAMSLVGPLARYLGIAVDQGALDHVFLAFLAYVGAQGVADFGKSASQVTAGQIGIVTQTGSVWGDLLTSKKFVAALSAAFVAVVGPIAIRLGIGVDQGTLNHIFLALLAYVGAQGVADFGKSASQVNALTVQAKITTLPK